ncbi:hypothetical protein [Komagataeibacter saccharivorans]|uniref:hypothetical protein n=1 Tax=Komagataeibacter saccharivorans TaxID=265959 RepID=UPI0014053645|nr:hypothetical protein [Komagataeibacter saccharivorans]
MAIFLVAMCCSCIPPQLGNRWYELARHIMIWAFSITGILAFLLAPYPISKQKLSKMELFHFTNRRNKYGMMSGDIASLNISRACYTNIGNILIGKCLFMFNGNPRGIYKLINLLGKYNNLDEAVVIVSGKNIQGQCYGRLLDNSILVPFKYNGPAVWNETKSASVSVSRS